MMLHLDWASQDVFPMIFLSYGMVYKPLRHFSIDLIVSW